MRRLYVQIYLAFLAVGLLSLVVTACLAGVLFDRPLQHAPDDVSVWDARGRLTASARQERRRSFLTLLSVMAATVAVGCWPIARRITRRLELVKDGMGRWGAGELAVRVPVEGQDEIAGVARTFNDAADRVQSLFDAQRRVLASASHELRSPLARLRMSLALLDDSDPGRATLVRSAERDIEELDATVSDILHVGRMQALDRPADPEPVDVLALLREEGEKVGATVDGPPRVVHGDARLLRRLARNLFENARRHGGPPIEARTTATGFEVSDRGPGVPAEHREAIFQPFWRPPGHVEGRDGGVGLGLHLVREIARHHGGDVHAEERAGGGSRFVVVLPT